MKTTKVVIAVLLISSILSPMFLITETVSAGTFPNGPYSSWTYWRVININASTSNDSYQMALIVNKTTGNINCGGHCNNDFSDLRFLDIDNTTELPYWIENSTSGDFALVWVKTPADLTTDHKFIMAYGKTVASASNGANTWSWFDDFLTDTTGAWIDTDTTTIQYYAHPDRLTNHTIHNSSRFRFGALCNHWHVTDNQYQYHGPGLFDNAYNGINQSLIPVFSPDTSDNPSANDDQFGFGLMVWQSSALADRTWDDVTVDFSDHLNDKWNSYDVTSANTTYPELTMYANGTAPGGTNLSSVRNVAYYANNSNYTHVKFQLNYNGDATTGFNYTNNHLEVAIYKTANAHVSFLFDWMAYGKWNSTEPAFESLGAEQSEAEWGSWADTWTISQSHTCSDTGYEYGNWSFSEHINASTLDEAWAEANTSHWYVGDNSSWWGGEHTYCANTAGVNSSFTVLNNSGLNRTQGFGWCHINDTDDGFLYPYIIFAYSGATDFDVVMWDPFAGGHVWALNWNGTNMTDISTGTSVVYPSSDATDIDTGVWEWADYLTLDGNYYKYIYNELAGTLKFKYWSGGAFNEPAYWATDYQHNNLTHDTYRCQGIGFWNPYNREAFMEWDLMNIWQLKYTTNASSWCNISSCNESRPHMDFPVIDIAAWSAETMTYFNDTFDGNMTADLTRSVMKNNITNLMNLESRMFEMNTLEANDQNDTVYYYSCLVDNYTAFDAEAEYDEYLHLHIQMCPEDEIDINEYGDVMVAIDIDNNRVWDTNDRMFCAYAKGTYAVTKAEYNGNGDAIPATFGCSIWESDTNAVGNLHRYNSHLNYVLNIPLATLIKTDSTPLNVSDVFGLSVITTMSGASTAMETPSIWQNWNETSEAPFWGETNFASAQVYFLNGTGESETGGDLPSSTHIGRWGEGVISDAFDASGAVSSNMSIEASFNDTSSSQDEDYVLVNVTINITNDGAGNLNDIYLNMSWWNCSCSDLNMTFIDSNQDISNFTFYNDSCYIILHNVSVEPLTPSSSWDIWVNINITNCSAITSATETLNITANATELTEDVILSGDDAPTFRWGRSVIAYSYDYVTAITDAGDIGNSVFNIIGVLLIISAILIIIGMVTKYRR